jgi:adenylate cyclase
MDFAAEGLLDGIEDGRARAERVALLEELLADGVSLEELKAAVAEDRLVFLRVERTLGAARYTPREVAELTGIPIEDGLRYRQALGLPRPEAGERVLTDRDVEALRQLKAFEAAGLPEEGLIEMARVLGESLSRVAAAVRLFVRDALLAPDVGEHELTIAFADLVDFTKLGEQIPAEELGAIARRLLELAAEAVRPPVRLVKTIGDAAMLVSPDAGALLDVAIELVRLADAEGDEFPRLRAGLATGAALQRAGDWYGSPVNVASRVTSIARAGSIVATEATRAAANGDGRWRFSSLPPRRLKGVDGTVPLFRVRPADAEPDGVSRL